MYKQNHVASTTILRLYKKLINSNIILKNSSNGYYYLTSQPFAQAFPYTTT
jgi:hypothetical protein